MKRMSATTPATVEKQHVTRTPGVCGGKPCIVGTRIRVWDVAVLTEMGRSPDEVLVAYPHLSLADVYGALTYYYDHKAEIDAQAAADERFVEELRRRTGPGPLERMEREGFVPRRGAP